MSEENEKSIDWKQCFEQADAQREKLVGELKAANAKVSQLQAENNDLMREQPTNVLGQKGPTGDLSWESLAPLEASLLGALTKLGNYNFPLDQEVARQVTLACESITAVAKAIGLVEGSACVDAKRRTAEFSLRSAENVLCPQQSLLAIVTEKGLVWKLDVHPTYINGHYALKDAVGDLREKKASIEKMLSLSTIQG